MSRSNVSVVRALGVGTFLSFSQQVSCRYEEHVSSTVCVRDTIASRTRYRYTLTVVQAVGK